MFDDIFLRSTGAISSRSLEQAETHRLLNSIRPAPGYSFDGSTTTSSSETRETSTQGTDVEVMPSAVAHKAGVNCMTIDRFEGRYLLSGGSDSSLALWDLENPSNHTFRPVASLGRGSSSHSYGITHLSFYPFDSQAFLSSSYDHTLKLYSTEQLTTSASFDLNSVIYSHALSPVATHLLVACATQHPAVRLVDLRSGANTQGLAGHQGAVLSVAWSPINEFIIATGGVDGTARLWDIRRSASSLGVFDLDDAIGVMGDDGYGSHARPRHQGKAHVGACNGVVWKDDGKVLVTAGHDERVRVWDVGLGADMLSHFGPTLKNTRLSTVLPLLVPHSLSLPPQSVMIYPNEKEILMFDLFDGTLLEQFRFARGNGQKSSQRNVQSRVSCLAWRTGDVEFYSAHFDGTIRLWKPESLSETSSDEEDADVHQVNEHHDERKRKREELNEMFRDLTRQKITFT